ncbi:MAG: cobalt ECF transporter T component CbiQ [Theionarchaea archaeon]|nr:cobalt ECF transporter T component CbiQ [Theionarchaea archaeon]
MNRDLIYRLDPRMKILSVFFLIFVAVSGEQNVGRFSFFFFLLFSIAVYSGVSLLFLFKRSLVIIPFVVLVAIFLPFFGSGETVEVFTLHLSVEGIQKFGDIVMKAFLSVFSVSMLIETTEFPDLLKGFEKLKMPKIMVILISFTYRYFSVILKEARRMKTARDIRSKGGNFVWQLRTFGNILGQLFIRSYERSERVYQAMYLRGFTGDIITLDTFRMTGKDILCGLSFCAVVFVIRVIV